MTTKKMFLIFMGLILFVLATTPVKAGVSAAIFGDYYYIGKSPTSSQEKLNGFWLRRIYITYDADISDKLKARARLEMANDGKLGTSALNITPYVKDAYIAYQFDPLHSLIIGIQDSLTWSNIEKFYGYRHLERTPFDLYKNRSSRDFGIALKGSFDKNKKIGYAVMFGNLSGNKDETDKYKQLSASLIFNNAIPNFMFEINGDFAKKSAAKKTSLLQAFGGFQGDWGRIGLNYGWETIKETGKPDVEFKVFSAFVIGKFSKKIEAIARYDAAADPQPNGQDTFFLIQKNFKTNVFIAGLGWNIHPKFQVMPNLKMVTYKEDASGVKPNGFTQFNITFFYQF